MTLRPVIMGLFGVLTGKCSVHTPSCNGHFEGPFGVICTIQHAVLFNPAARKMLPLKNPWIDFPKAVWITVFVYTSVCVSVVECFYLTLATKALQQNVGQPSHCSAYTEPRVNSLVMATRGQPVTAQLKIKRRGQTCSIRGHFRFALRPVVFFCRSSQLCLFPVSLNHFLRV